MNSTNIALDEFTKLALHHVRNRMEKKLEEEASKIVVEEMAKFSLEMATLMRVVDNGHEIIITIRKDFKTTP